MPADSHIATWLLAAYALFAASVAYRVLRHGKRAFDEHFTDIDRRTVGAATFYLAVPTAVAVKVAAQLATAAALGAAVETTHYTVFWSYVVTTPRPGSPSWAGAAVALSGILCLSILGAGAIAHAVRRPFSAAWNFARLELGRVCLGLIWLFYPIASLIVGEGDFAQLHQALSQASGLFGAGALTAYAGLLAVLWWAWRRPEWRRHYLRLATPIFHWIARAERELTLQPGYVPALCDLGRAWLACDMAPRALEPLERAVSAAPRMPRPHYLLGLAHLRLQRPQQASAALRQAGQLIVEEGQDTREDRQLRYEVTLALAHARLALDDAEGALLTAEAGLALDRRDARGILTHSDALVAMGRPKEAEARLVAALDHAKGLFAQEIRRRLASLARSR